MLEEVSDYPAIRAFLRKREPKSSRRLESKWRKENLILKVECEQGNYVVKIISSQDKLDEIERVQLLRKHYPFLTPQVRVYERNAYIMDYIEGKNFFDLEASERVERLTQSSQLLSGSWNGQHFPKVDIREMVRKSFERYRKKSSRFFSEEELPTPDLSCFALVPGQPSHNDLNAANLIYDTGIKLIDPSNEGYNDTGRDVGRYLASCFFNNYDYFGNNKTHSLELAEAFLGSFHPEVVERARFYTGESFLSFINFPTRTTPPEVLKRLAINTLLSPKPLLKALEDSL